MSHSCRKVLDIEGLQLRLHTNDYRVDSSPKRYSSTSRYPNTKFCILIFLTHFFSLQRGIPRCIQNKYFQFLRDKLLDRISIIKKRQQLHDLNNRSSKTFFNFSYKRYRFYLGIFILCGSQLPNPLGSPSITNIVWTVSDLFCSLPVPFVLSQHPSSRWQGCCIHQHLIRKYYNHPVPDLTSSSTDSQHSAALCLLYKSWFDRTVKHNYSPRTGCHFDTRYERYTYENNSPYYYKKVYFNYKVVDCTFTYSKKTLDKQAKRHERHYRHCVSTCKQHVKYCLNQDGSIKLARLKFSMSKLKYLSSPDHSIKCPITHSTHSKHTYGNPYVKAFLPTRMAVRRRYKALTKDSDQVMTPVDTPTLLNTNNSPFPDSFIFNQRVITRKKSKVICLVFGNIMVVPHQSCFMSSSHSQQIDNTSLTSPVPFDDSYGDTDFFSEKEVAC
ncbi:hypothetical protein RclHR1_03400016 [Rhizophagus clarus]|nr:hypothetical protein RclHR1_03400016 [Rhizophagus clarus]